MSGDGIMLDFRCLVFGHVHQEPDKPPRCGRCGMPIVATIFETKTLWAYLADWTRWHWWRFKAAIAQTRGKNARAPQAEASPKES